MLGGVAVSDRDSMMFFFFLDSLLMTGWTCLAEAS